MDRRVALIDGKLVDIDLNENYNVLHKSIIGKRILESFKQLRVVVMKNKRIFNSDDVYNFREFLNYIIAVKTSPCYH